MLYDFAVVLGVLCLCALAYAVSVTKQDRVAKVARAMSSLTATVIVVLLIGVLRFPPSEENLPGVVHPLLALALCNLMCNWLTAPRSMFAKMIGGETSENG